MADPVSLLAIAALVYTGRSLSKKPENYTEIPGPGPSPGPSPAPPTQFNEFKENDFVSQMNTQQKREVENFGDISRQQRSGGQEVLNMRNRMYDQGRMNNLSPIEKQLVGPGLGVGADTPAVGGYQQMFRINPINVGEYRLTTLPGRSGPAMDVTGGRSAKVGELTHNKPETTAYLPSRLPVMAGRAQGMTGVVPRSEHEMTKRTTNRSETGLRDDGLGFSGAKRLVSAQTLAQDPTRFKGDRNDEHYAYVNHPTPGIHSFHGAYTNSAAAQVTAKTNEELMKFGFRPEDRRGKANRMGNAGRMNVRESALKQGGRLTTVRSDTTRVDGRINAANGGWTQQYQNNTFHQLNPYKGNENPNSRTLDVATRQLKNNPFSHSLYS